MRITKRELITSCAIIGIWMCMGILIAGKIHAWQQDRNAKYDRAVKITEQDVFEHGMKTNLGNAFVYGELKAHDPVSYTEIDGQYSYILKIKERYTQHTKIVTKTRTNAKGDQKTCEEVETYWTWDEVNRDSRQSETIDFMNVTFKSDKFRLPNAEYVGKIMESCHVRYKYYGVSDCMTGTVYTWLGNGTIREQSEFYHNKTIEETTGMLEKERYLILFWVVWIAVIFGLVYGFCYLENSWLNK